MHVHSSMWGGPGEARVLASDPTPFRAWLLWARGPQAVLWGGGVGCFPTLGEPQRKTKEPG